MSAFGLILLAGWGLACPFCTAPQPTLSERRDAAAVVALGEVESATGEQRVFRLRQILKGRDRLQSVETLTVSKGATSLAPGSLALLLATANEAELNWDVLPVNETSLAYFVRAPAMRLPSAQRLTYFIRYFEYPDSLAAEDAYAEFGRAPYDDVAQLAEQLPMDRLRAWLTSDGVPEQRKGLYGLLLGLAKADADRRSNMELLRSIIEKPANDLRAGFDGILGGYLVAAGEPGLQQIEERFLANPSAARGDVLHTITALRFYFEYGNVIPRERLADALAKLLDRPDFAATVVIDLARWQAWDKLNQVAALYGREGYGDPAIERAVIGYLLVCPKPSAMQIVARIREKAPERVAEAERAIARGADTR